MLSRTLSLGHAYVVEHPGQVVGIILAFAIGGFLFRNLLAQMDAIAAAEAAEDAAYEALQDEIWEALQQAQ